MFQDMVEPFTQTNHVVTLAQAQNYDSKLTLITCQQRKIG